MSEVTNTLQQLVFGDRNVFIFQETKAEQAYNVVDKIVVTRFLTMLETKGYAITNPLILMHMTIPTFNRFQEELNDLFNANTKEGVIFRKTFASEEELQRYTDEEWGAILAQYAITYDWTDKYQEHFNASAEDTLNSYVGSLDLNTFNSLNNGKIKTFTVGDKKTLAGIIRNILESKSVLRAQQLATLNNAPIDVVKFAAKYANITVKEILINVAILLLHENLDYPLLRTPTDVVRFVAAHLTKGDNFEGQLSKTELAKIKLHIPTSMRKMLLHNLEMIGFTHNKQTNSGIRYLCEDMLKFTNFWKRLNKFLCFEKATAKRQKYPLFTQAIDLLYSGDRSWTFNSRYEEAKKRGDYMQACMVMREKPTLLVRNLLEFMRMTKGTEFPQKETDKHAVTMRKPRNAFTDAMTDKTKPATKETIINTVQTDAAQYLNSHEFEQLLENKTNHKVLWQIVEQLHDENIYEPRFKREVQGKLISYSVPIPAVNRELATNVERKVLDILKRKTADKKVYIDPTATGYKLQYSGRKSTEISFAGEFITPGTELSLESLLEGKDIKKPLLRLGVMWRGRSMDIDHSLITSRGDTVYYGAPTLEINDELVISSSGDITSCSTDKFSTELVDIDLTKIDANNIEHLFNNFIVFSGARPIGDVECYTFFSIIDKKDRIMKGNKATLDLAQQDYAIRIDPDNTDKTGSYIGCTINLKEGFIKVHALPIKKPNGHYSNARLQHNQMVIAIATAPSTKGLTVDYALEHVFTKVNTIAEADIIITKKEYSDTELTEINATIIHPGRDGETIQQLLF